MPTQNDYDDTRTPSTGDVSERHYGSSWGVPKSIGLELKPGSRQRAEEHKEHPQPQTARDLDGNVLSVHCLAARELAVADSFLCLRHKTVAADP
ncbi:MAG: hypothetical protein VCB14_12065 [Alphaproteobacteria bacterium]